MSDPAKDAADRMVSRLFDTLAVTGRRGKNVEVHLSREECSALFEAAFSFGAAHGRASERFDMARLIKDHRDRMGGATLTEVLEALVEK